MEKFNMGFINSFGQCFDKYVLSEIVLKASKVLKAPLDDYDGFYTIAVTKPSLAIISASLYNKRYTVDSRSYSHILSMSDYISKVDMDTKKGFDSFLSKETRILRLDCCIMGLSGFEEQISEAIILCYIVFLHNLNVSKNVCWSYQFRTSCLDKIAQIENDSLNSNQYLRKLSRLVFEN